MVRFHPNMENLIVNFVYCLIISGIKKIPTTIIWFILYIIRFFQAIFFVGHTGIYQEKIWVPARNYPEDKGYYLVKFSHSNEFMMLKIHYQNKDFLENIPKNTRVLLSLKIYHKSRFPEVSDFIELSPVSKEFYLLSTIGNPI